MKRVRYTQEQREWAIGQMMPPLNRAVTELARATGITDVTLRTWQKMARAQGKIMPGSGKQADRWSSVDKFRMVLEAAPLSETELAAYCRRKGVYPEQIVQWRQACELANMPAAAPEVKAKPSMPPAPQSQAQAQAQEKRIAQLERAMRKKDRALAEAEALLELQKKAAAIWGKDKEE